MHNAPNRLLSINKTDTSDTDGSRARYTSASRIHSGPHVVTCVFSRTHLYPPRIIYTNTRVRIRNISGLSGLRKRSSQNTRFDRARVVPVTPDRTHHQADKSHQLSSGERTNDSEGKTRVGITGCLVFWLAPRGFGNPPSRRLFLSPFFSSLLAFYYSRHFSFAHSCLFLSHPFSLSPSSPPYSSSCSSSVTAS